MNRNLRFSDEEYQTLKGKVRAVDSRAVGPRPRGHAEDVVHHTPKAASPAPLSFTLLGKMQSGKNRILITRTGHRYPPARFKTWRDEKVAELTRQYRGPCIPKSVALALTVAYTPGDKIRRDVPGILDALCHILERAQIVEDDAQITAVDWQQLDLDRERPRVELSLRARGGG